MIRTIRTGATSVARELSTSAINAPMNARFSVANSGMNFLLDSRSDRLGRGPVLVSSLYFIVARAPLGIVKLDIFGRRLHQFLVFSNGQHLALHQKDDLVVIHHRCNLLRHRNQRDSRIILCTFSKMARSVSRPHAP